MSAEYFAALGYRTSLAVYGIATADAMDEAGARLSYRTSLAVYGIATILPSLVTI